ncbi:inner membrane CreD family protein, partial [Desulfovibrio porci]|uniref:inner membrane CreD family protein n=1 Tax=Desulfovibrio porci TaxID=2605782 RepID=UPI003A91E7BD
MSRFAIVAAIALALLIPLLLVQNLVDERASLYRNVVQDISRTWGGQQQLIGPMLLIPYTERQITRRRGPGKEATGGGNQG